MSNIVTSNPFHPAIAGYLTLNSKRIDEFNATHWQDIPLLHEKHMRTIAEVCDADGIDNPEVVPAFPTPQKSQPALRLRSPETGEWYVFVFYQGDKRGQISGYSEAKAHNMIDEFRMVRRFLSALGELFPLGLLPK